MPINIGIERPGANANLSWIMSHLRTLRRRGWPFTRLTPYDIPRAFRVGPTSGTRREHGDEERSHTLVQVVVRENNVDQALRALKKKMQREGIFREMKLRKSYEKPSEKRAREKSEAVRRARKLERKRIEREGF